MTKEIRYEEVNESFYTYTSSFHVILSCPNKKQCLNFDDVEEGEMEFLINVAKARGFEIIIEEHMTSHKINFEEE